MQNLVDAGITDWPGHQRMDGTPEGGPGGKRNSTLGSPLVKEGEKAVALRKGQGVGMPREWWVGGPEET